MSILTITRGARGFKVSTDNSNIIRRIEGFGESLTHEKLERSRGQVYTVEGDKYYSVAEQTKDFYFINACYPAFAEMLDSFSQGAGFTATDIKHLKVQSHKGREVTFDNHTFSVEEPEGSKYHFQNEIVEYVCEPSNNHAILELQTGTGKSIIAMKSIVNLSKRTLIITKPSYLDKWTNDLTTDPNGLKLRPGELMRIGGSSSGNKLDEVDSLIEMGKDGELEKVKAGRECKIVLISSRTLDNWIKRELTESKHPRFNEFVESIGIGLVVYDESHEWFRANYISFLLFNIRKVVDLSATLIPGDDSFIAKRYEERFPTQCRYDKLELKKYIDVIGIYYHITDRDVIQKVNRMKMYNHIEFEKRIMRKDSYQKTYFEMVTKLIRMFYKTDAWEKGQKAIVFMSSREMCTRYTEYLEKEFPELDIKRHIQGDNYDAFINADISVTTPGKSGTAVDIPGLILNITTVCLSKEDKNVQILGRTRQHNKWNIAPKALYLHCQQLVKHTTYMKRRRKMLTGRAKSFKILNSNFIIK